MDETLIHCVDDLNENTVVDKQLEIVFSNGEKAVAGINVRPYALECLREAAKLF